MHIRVLLLVVWSVLVIFATGCGNPPPSGPKDVGEAAPAVPVLPSGSPTEKADGSDKEVAKQPPAKPSGIAVVTNGTARKPPQGEYANGSDHPPPDPGKGTPYEGKGMEAEEVQFFTRVETLLEATVGADGVVNKAAQHGAEALKNRSARAEAAMKLGQYRLKLTPEARKTLLELTYLTRKYEPVGSFSRVEKQVAWQDETPALNGEWAAILKEAEQVLRKKISDGKPFDETAAQKLKKLLTREFRVEVPGSPELGVKLPDVTAAVLRGPRPHRLPPDAFPDLKTAILDGDLTGAHVLTFLFDLEDCAKQIRWHRARDQELLEVLAHFSNEDKFFIFDTLDPSNLEEVGKFKFRTKNMRTMKVNRQDLDAKYGFTAHLKQARAGYIVPLAASQFHESDFWKKMSADLFKDVVATERMKQLRFSKLVIDRDAAALEALRKAHTLHDQLATFLETAVSMSGHKFRRLAVIGKDGKLTEPALPAYEYKVIDPIRYVVKVHETSGAYDYDSATVGIEYAHRMDGENPLLPESDLGGKGEKSKLGKAVKIDFPPPESELTYEVTLANGQRINAETVVKIKTVEGAAKGEQLLLLVNHLKEKEIGTEEIQIKPGIGVYQTKIKGSTISPAFLKLPLHDAQENWLVDATDGAIKIKYSSSLSKKKMTVMGEEREVFEVTSVWDVPPGGVKKTNTETYCDGLGFIGATSSSGDTLMFSMTLKKFEKK